MYGDKTHPYVWHDSFKCVTWLIHMCDMDYPYVWRDSSIYMTWLIHICDMSHPYVWHDSSIFAKWLIHTFNMNDLYVWRDSSMCVTWLIHWCDMTQSQARSRGFQRTVAFTDASSTKRGVHTLLEVYNPQQKFKYKDATVLEWVTFYRMGYLLHSGINETWIEVHINVCKCECWNLEPTPLFWK